MNDVLTGALVDEDAPCACWCSCTAVAGDALRCDDCEAGEHVIEVGGEG